MKIITLLFLFSSSLWANCYQEFSDRKNVYVIYKKGLGDYILQAYHKKIDGRFLATDEIYRNKNDEVVWESGEMKKATEIDLMKDFYSVDCPF